MTYWNIDNIHDNPILSEELKKIQEKFWKIKKSFHTDFKTIDKIKNFTK